MTTILALDLGTKMGWALLLQDGTIMSGTYPLTSTSKDGAGMVFLRFKRWLDGMRKHLGADSSICYEAVKRHMGTDAAHMFGGFFATLSTWCEMHKIPYEGVGVSEVKKHATGKGNASKDDVITAMRLKKHKPEDDNEADALAILYLAMDLAGVTK